MFRNTLRPGSNSDEDFQNQILVHVSRTFALTIPQLTNGLRTAVTTAYLLCRIADTIEDEPVLSSACKRRLLTRFSDVVAGRADATALAVDLARLLSDRTSAYEYELAVNLPRVMFCCCRLNVVSQRSIQRCIDTMCVGMHHFQCRASLGGLQRLTDLDSYCYHVAGVVGEMLTDLFCAHSPRAAARAPALRRLAPSFGQGLQMTNILKDIWEDRSRGACWLPREVFERRGFDLDHLAAADGGSFAASLYDLIGIAHGHLRHALSFTLLIPVTETGMRRFCSWSIGLALLTLRAIYDNPDFSAGAQVKISHREVMMVTICSNLTVHSDRMLTRLFDYAAQGLPLTIPPLARGASQRNLPVPDLQSAHSH